jgi:hypothetical protein
MIQKELNFIRRQLCHYYIPDVIGSIEKVERLVSYEKKLKEHILKALVKKAFENPIKEYIENDTSIALMDINFRSDLQQYAIQEISSMILTKFSWFSNVDILPIPSYSQEFSSVRVYVHEPQIKTIED